MPQLRYKEYSNIAKKLLQVYINRMDGLLEKKGDPFDGRWVSVFAHHAREAHENAEEFQYPNPQFVSNLRNEMEQYWTEYLTKNPKYKPFSVKFDTQMGRHDKLELMIQVYQP